jgi:hypothetical protein
LNADGARVIPLYDNGLVGSEVEHLGIDAMIPLDHNEGIIPELKHILHILCKIQTAALY